MKYKKLKYGFKIKDFQNFITKLEFKSEFTCSPYANGPGSCACHGPSSYCTILGCNHAIVI